MLSFSIYPQVFLLWLYYTGIWNMIVRKFIALRVKKIHYFKQACSNHGIWTHMSTNACMLGVSFTSLGQRCMGNGMQTAPSSNQLTMSTQSHLRGIAHSTVQRNSDVVQCADHSTGRNRYITCAHPGATSKLQVPEVWNETTSNKGAHKY